MAVTSDRVIGVTFTGDVNAPNLAYPAAQNAASPGAIVVANLAMGANTITVPSGAKAVTILPPSGNTVVLTLKGISGDTGIAIHLTDPTSLGLGTSVTSFVINAASAVTGMRYVWS